MEIIKNGEPMVRAFVCKLCKCEFTAAVSEYKVLLNDNGVIVRCPYCNNLIEATLEDAPLVDD